MKKLRTIGKLGIGISVAAISLFSTVQPASAILKNTFEFIDETGTSGGSLEKVIGEITFDSLNPGDTASGVAANSFVITEIPDFMLSTWGDNEKLRMNTDLLPISSISQNSFTVEDGLITSNDFWIYTPFDESSEIVALTSSLSFIEENFGNGNRVYAQSSVFTLPTYTSTTAVPFEFSPTLGLLTVGGIFGISRLCKNLVARKSVKNISA